MAIGTEEIKRLFAESTMFDPTGQQLDVESLTPEQQIALQRQGRTARVQGTPLARRGITGGRTQLEGDIMGVAGQQLASGSTLIVPNVQVGKEFRQDIRSRGGERPLAAQMGTPEIPTPWTSPELPALPAYEGLGPVAPTQGAPEPQGMGLLGYLKYGKRAMDIYRDIQGAEGVAPMAGPEVSPQQLQAMAEENLARTGGTQYGQADPAGLAQAEAQIAAQTGIEALGIGAPHAASLAAGGITPATVAAAQGMGEGALNIAAAQSLAQQAGVGGASAALAAGSASGVGFAGGSPVAGLAAAEAAAAGGGAAGMGAAGAGGMLAAGATTLGLGALASMAGKTLMGAYEGFFGKDPDPWRLPHSEVLRAAEGEITTDPFGQPYDIREEDGVRYLRDPYTAQHYGQEYYHTISDPEYMDLERQGFIGELSRSDPFYSTQEGRGLRESLEEYRTAMPTRGEAYDPAINERLRAIQAADIAAEQFKTTGYKGLASTDIQQQYQDLTGGLYSAMQPSSTSRGN